MTRGVSIHSFLLDSLSLEGCQRDAADVVAADRACHPTTAVAIHLTPDAAEKLAIAYGISLDVDTKPPCWTHGNQFKLVACQVAKLAKQTLTIARIQFQILVLQILVLQILVLILSEFGDRYPAR